MITGNVDNPFAYLDVPVDYELPRLERRDRGALLVDEGLQPPPEEVLHAQVQHVVESDALADKAPPAEAVEQLLSVLGADIDRGGEQVPRLLSDVAELPLGLPKLPLVPEAVSADEVELLC